MKWLGSIFDNKGEDQKKAFPWIPLREQEQIQAIKSASYESPVLIYKHSTRCAISSVVLSRMESNEELATAGVSFYFLDLIRYRSLSNAIADTWQIRHESPQVILLNRGEVIWHGSHGAISAERILEKLS